MQGRARVRARRAPAPVCVDSAITSTPAPRRARRHAPPRAPRLRRDQLSSTVRSGVHRSPTRCVMYRSSRRGLRSPTTAVAMIARSTFAATTCAPTATPARWRTNALRRGSTASMIASETSARIATQSPTAGRRRRRRARHAERRAARHVIELAVRHDVVAAMLCDDTRRHEAARASRGANACARALGPAEREKRRRPRFDCHGGSFSVGRRARVRDDDDVGRIAMGDRRERSGRAKRGQDHDVRDGGTHRRLEECVRAMCARECSLARALARVKHAPSRELRERHARRRNGRERLGEMIEHRMRLAGKCGPTRRSPRRRR